MNKVVDTQELLPCPWCFGPAEFNGNGVNSKVFGIVHCQDSSCLGHHWPDGEYGGWTHATTKAEAILAWNTRSTQCSGDTQELAFTREYTNRLLDRIDSHLKEPTK